MEKKLFVTLMLFILTVFSHIAQERKITPVDVDDQKPKQPTLHYFDKHGNPLDEPVLFLAELDTVKNVRSGPVYPLLTSVSLGVNVFDAIMNCIGQNYGAIDFCGELSLHNWFVPTLELGIGWGKKDAPDANYVYTAKPSVYARIGFNYNFLYKSNPDYQVYAGLRAGVSNVNYEIKDITISSGYWGETTHPQIGSQNATAFYGQALLGMRAKIYKNFSMGWSVRYNFKFNTPQGSNSIPWYVPGYGANNKLTATFSFIYTIPLIEYSKYGKQKKQ